MLHSHARSLRAAWPSVLCAAAALAWAATLPRPAHAGPHDQALARGAAFLQGVQDNDGSWQNANGALRFIETAQAALALSASNQRTPAYYKAVTWVENHAARNADEAARRVLVLASRGASVAPDLDRLAKARFADGSLSGYGLSQNYLPSPLDTALALQALRAAQAPAGLITEATAYLKAKQLASSPQGWPAVPGGGLDVVTTAQAILALGTNASCDAATNNALNALQASVTTASPLRHRALAVQAFIRCNRGSEAAPVALINSLTSATAQAGDGSWGTGAYDTGLVMTTLAAASARDLAADRVAVAVPDHVLRKAINDQLGKGAMDQINVGEMKSLIVLNASGLGITDLTGLEKAINLADADFSGNGITSTSPILGLAGYPNFNLGGNPVAQNESGEAPLPAWALALLASSLVGAVARKRRGQAGAALICLAAGSLVSAPAPAHAQETLQEQNPAAVPAASRPAGAAALAIKRLSQPLIGQQLAALRPTGAAIVNAQAAQGDGFDGEKVLADLRSDIEAVLDDEQPALTEPTSAASQTDAAASTRDRAAMRAPAGDPAQAAGRRARLHAWSAALRQRAQQQEAGDRLARSTASPMREARRVQRAVLQQLADQLDQADQAPARQRHALLGQLMQNLQTRRTPVDPMHAAWTPPAATHTMLRPAAGAAPAAASPPAPAKRP